MFRQKTSLTISSKFLLSKFFSPVSSKFIRMAHNHLPSELVRDSKPSIWVEFTALAAECGAVNLGQGFPDNPAPKFATDILKEISLHPEQTPWHQYTRGFGHPRLVNALAKLYSNTLQNHVNPQTDILITVGAYLALYYSFLGWLNKGDEVIVLEPAYDSYLPQIKMAGGVPVSVVMELSENPKTSEDYKLDLNKIESKITKKTKMLVLNNPHNPTGKLFTRKELEGLAEIAKKHDLIVIADEVYEWHVYPGHEMIRFATLPGMYERTITIGSAGKAFSVTGWKTGWAIGPSNLLQPLKSIHQNCIFTSITPIQEAIAQCFEKEIELIDAGKKSESYLFTGLSSQLESLRDRLVNSCSEAGLKPIVPQAGYFLMADFNSFDGPFKDAAGSSDLLDFRFVRWLCREKKLATIPPSAFYSDENKKGHDHFVRLCFFKKDSTLDAADEILKQFKK
jgi:kynurenine--oxoglutarate transaminase/cysteine-S-conjugate beta-lyase/glutamine--phenylpyruvate transaminase